MRGIYGNATSASHVGGAALHWYDYGVSLSFDNMDAIHALAPTKPMLNTEACYLDSLVTNWKINALYMADIIGGMNHWLNGWGTWEGMA